VTLEIIKKLFNCPTAPFREGFVLQTVEEILRANGIPYHYDKIGNLIAGWNGSKASKKKIKIGFMAHTDHPGFHFKKQRNEDTIDALWLGGAPFKKMKGAKVRFYDPADRDWNATGKIMELAKTHDHRGGIKIVIKLNKKQKIPKLAFGAFDFDGFKLNGKNIVTRAADDLAGCVIQLTALLDSYHHFPGRAIAVFSRAEEVGFVGCLAAINNRTLPSVPFISLEASKELEGARMGKGPVLRLGDRTSLFDTGLSQALLVESQKLKKDFMFQRRIMDGGNCEATALNIWGFKASGLSVPLGNYHNQGGRGPAPEIIHLDDVEHARKLCREMIKNFEPDRWHKDMQKKFKELVKQNKTQLKLSNLNQFVRQSGRWPF